MGWSHGVRGVCMHAHFAPRPSPNESYYYLTCYGPQRVYRMDASSPPHVLRNAQERTDSLFSPGRRFIFDHDQQISRTSQRANEWMYGLITVEHREHTEKSTASVEPYSRPQNISTIKFPLLKTKVAHICFCTAYYVAHALARRQELDQGFISEIMISILVRRLVLLRMSERRNGVSTSALQPLSLHQFQTEKLLA